MALTYSDYLKIDTLLGLQRVRSDPPEHDETLFIIVHQVYELWFKQLLHEFDKVNRDFSAGDLFGAIATWKRVRTIMKTMVAQLDIIETMTPLSFSSFRDRLEAASGFQSAQFRELEFLLGYKRPAMLKHYETSGGPPAALVRRLNEPSVVDHFYEFLEHLGAKVPLELCKRDANLPAIANEQVQEAILGLYRSNPSAAILFEQMIDFDEGQQEWRYRHVKMVERTIGNKKGTGGSSGVEFLKTTLFIPIFADLWAVRPKM